MNPLVRFARKDLFTVVDLFTDFKAPAPDNFRPVRIDTHTVLPLPWFLLPSLPCFLGTHPLAVPGS